MNALLEDIHWSACTSAFRLDRWRLGELPEAEAVEVQAHLGSCPRCQEALDALASAEGEHRARALPLRGLSPLPRRAVRWLVLPAGAALAAAAVLALTPPGEVRSKGAPESIGMYVQHGGEVRRAAPGEAVVPGDSVRFTYSTNERRYLAILSIDGAGVASVYYPDGPRAAAVEPAHDAPLPLGTQLDGVLGEERVVGLFCDRPAELEPVRAALQASGPELPRVAGCRLVTFRFAKHAP